MPHRLVVVSNRLPVTFESVDGELRAGPAAGGLITALAPVMERNRGLWIGWPGSEIDSLMAKPIRDWNADHRYTIHPVPLSAREVGGYYHGFANQALWPLFHDFLGRSEFDLDQWDCYDAVNAKFASSIAETIEADDIIWVQDYQLLLAARHLRKMGVRQTLLHFLHIPFPSLDLFRRIPWRNEIIRAMLDFDHLGFQTAHDRRNFVHCVRELVPACTITNKGRETIIAMNGRSVRAGQFPVSIDFREFSDAASRNDVVDAATNLRQFYQCDRMLLGVDRLDYTKGIPHRFLALERALEKYPDLLGKVSLIQIVVPSRTQVPEYLKLKSQVERLAGQINGRYTAGGWVPIHYMYRAVDRAALLAHYRACEIALITSLRDGMNLVAKEYCASSVDGNGVLILSEFAGAADQLRPHALIVNPYDREATADAIHTAFRMGEHERKRRMIAMQAEIRRNDVHRWLRWILEPLFLSEPDQFRMIDEEVVAGGIA